MERVERGRRDAHRVGDRRPELSPEGGRDLASQDALRRVLVPRGERERRPDTAALEAGDRVIAHRRRQHLQPPRPNVTACGSFLFHLVLD